MGQMIDFSPDRFEVERLVWKLKQGEIKKYVWNFVHERTDANRAKVIAMACQLAEDDEERWICATIETDSEDFLVLVPESTL